MENVDLNVTQGSTFNIRIQLLDDGLNAVDLTGSEVRGVVKNKYSDPDTNILVNLDPVVYDAESGLVDILLTSSQTAQLPVTQALYDIERYSLSSGAEDTEKVLRGKFLIHPEITSGVDGDYS